MPSVRKAVPFILAVFLCAAGSAQADQNICAKLTLTGFNSSSINAGYEVTDIGASPHACSAGSANSCSACASAEFYPKNVGNYLCLPNTLLYSISSSCQTLLQQGANNDCKPNLAATFACPNQQYVMPSCNWRTNDNESEADWNWSLNFDGTIVVVSCSTTNYDTYQK